MTQFNLRLKLNEIMIYDNEF